MPENGNPGCFSPKENNFATLHQSNTIFQYSTHILKTA